MQAEKKSTNFPFAAPGTKTTRVQANFHFVFVTDDSGIHEVFEQIKIKLKDDCNNFLSLIYSISEQITPPLYAAELESLERRYFSQLITYYEFSGVNSCQEASDLNQKLLEIIINCNTCREIEFLLVGHDEFVARATDRLQFLGIHSNQIQSQIIK